MQNVSHPALTVHTDPVELLPFPADGLSRRWAVAQRPQFKADGFYVAHPDHPGQGWRAAAVCGWSGAFVPVGPVLDGDGRLLDADPA